MRFLTGLLLATILALASCGGAAPAAQAPAASLEVSDVSIQDREAVKDLGDGFEMKVRGTGEHKVILIKFPDDKHMTRLEDNEKFVAAAKFILIKLFGQDAFENGSPRFTQGPDDATYLWIHGKLFQVEPLYMTAETEAAIGIILFPAIGALTPDV